VYTTKAVSISEACLMAHIRPVQHLQIWCVQDTTSFIFIWPTDITMNEWSGHLNFGFIRQVLYLGHTLTNPYLPFPQLTVMVLMLFSMLCGQVCVPGQWALLTWHVLYTLFQLVVGSNLILRQWSYTNSSPIIHAISWNRFISLHVWANDCLIWPQSSAWCLAYARHPSESILLVVTIVPVWSIHHLMCHSRNQSVLCISSNSSVTSSSQRCAHAHALHHSTWIASVK